MLIIGLCILLVALRMNLPNGLLASELADNRYVTRIDDKVLALRSGNTA